MPEPNRIIAIGDIHGCKDALSGLLEWVAPKASDHFIILGDVVDRGHDVKGAVDLLIQLAKTCKVTSILGNHEEMMLNFLYSGDTDAFRYWVQFGGAETIESYGNLRNLMQLAPDHEQFYQGMVPFIEFDQAMLVHANYLSDADLSQTPADVLRWHHLDPSRLVPHYSGRPVIVGHTAQHTGEVFNRGFLVCIDTACYAGGRLTAMDVNAAEIWQVDHVGTRVTDAPVHLSEI